MSYRFDLTAGHNTLWGCINDVRFNGFNETHNKYYPIAWANTFKYSPAIFSVLCRAKCDSACSRYASSSSALDSTFASAPINAAASPFGNVTPQRPIASRSPPPSEPTTTHPHAIPSSATMPNGSCHREG